MNVKVIKFFLLFFLFWFTFARKVLVFILKYPYFSLFCGLLWFERLEPKELAKKS
jgi:hypothetical protein